MTVENKIYLNFDDLMEIVYKLCEELKKSGCEPDAIVGISRGGLIPGVMLSHYFNCEFVPFVMSFRDFQNQQDAGVIQQKLNDQESVLVIDDIADSGKTLTELSKLINDADGLVKYATLHKRHSSSFHPNYVATDEIKDDSWIVYPYEFFGDVAILADELSHMIGE